MDVSNRQLQVYPLLPGGDTMGLKPQRITTGEAVTGNTTERLRSENRYRQQRLQESQEPTLYWSMHQVQFKVPEGLQPPGKHLNNMCPYILEEHPPAY